MMKDNLVVVLLTCFFCFSIIVTADQTSFPTTLLKGERKAKSVISPLTNVTPVIDGNLDDTCWKEAGKITGFFRIKSSKAAKEKTAFYFTHDKNILYIGAVVSDPKMAADKTKRDQNIWEDDCIEIFLDPERNRKDKFHLIISATGVLYDAKSGKKSWNAVPDIAVRTRQYPDKGWTAEIAIPFKALDVKTPQKGKVWDMKLAREDYNSVGGVPKLSSWQYVSENFADPGAFGKLVFQDENCSVNGDFSKGLKGEWTNGSMWRLSKAGRGKGKLELLKDQGYKNKPCAKVTVSDYTQVQHIVPVTKNRNYRLACWVNIDELEKQRKLSFYTEKHAKVSTDYKKKGWQKLVTFDTSRGNYIALTFTIPGSSGSFLIDDIEVVELDNLPLSPDTICYTGNAIGEQARHNKQVDGKYTYFELGTDYYFLPQKSSRGTTDVIEYKGWIPFSQGKLTDGKPTFSKYMHWTKSPGKTIIMDLGKDEYITDIEIEPVMRKLTNPKIYLKQAKSNEYILIGVRNGKFGITQFKNINAHARFVRLDSGGECGYRELRIWGKKKSGNIIPKPYSAPVKKGSEFGKGKTFTVKSDFIIFPTPKELKVEKGTLKFTNEIIISIPENASSEFVYIAEDLATQLNTKIGTPVKIVKNDSKAIIQLSMLKEQGENESGEEGYTIVVSNDRATLTGGGLNGLFYSCQTLLQCIKSSGFQCLTIKDWPSYPFRSIQLWAKQLKSLKILRTVKAIARLKMNYIILMGGGGNLKKYVDPLYKLRMETIPICCAMPAAGWFSHGCVELNPGETEKSLPSRERTNPCPSHPDIDKRIDKEIARVADVPGKYVYINCDELYQEHKGARWNVCKFCQARNLSGGDLFADFLNKIYQRLEKIGKKPIMLDTMLHISYKGMDKAFEKIPKDIVISIWHPRVQKKSDKLGFKVIEFMDGDAWTIDHQNPGVIGAMIPGDGGLKFEKAVLFAETLWSGKNPDLDDPDTIQKLSMAMKMIHEAQINQNLPSTTAAPENFRPVDLSPAANASLSDEKAGDGIGLFDEGKGMDLSFMKGKFNNNGVPFVISGKDGKDIVVMGNHAELNRRFPSVVKIPVDQTAASLIFIHTMTVPMAWTYSSQIAYSGTYIIEYDDKTKTAFPINYKTNILEYDTLTNQGVGYKSKVTVLPQAVPAFKGLTKSGKSILLMQTEWVNPFPQKKISNIKLQTPIRGLGTRIALFALTAVIPGNLDKRLPSLKKPVLLRPLADKKLLDGMKEIDLSGGKLDSDTDYLAPNGIKIHVSSDYYLGGATFIHSMKAGFVTFDSNFGWQVTVRHIIIFTGHFLPVFAVFSNFNIISEWIFFTEDIFRGFGKP